MMYLTPRWEPEITWNDNCSSGDSSSPGAALEGELCGTILLRLPPCLPKTPHLQGFPNLHLTILKETDLCSREISCDSRSSLVLI